MSRKNNEVLVALISLLGVIATAIFFNWDKLFLKPNEGLVQVRYQGYKPTGDFETEFRYYLEVSGGRKSSNAMKQEMIDRYKAKFKATSPEAIQEMETYVKFIENIMDFDKMTKEVMPLFRRHFTIEELQELNKFYSTAIMQKWVSKLPYIAHDQVELIEKLVKEANDKWGQLESNKSSRGEKGLVN